MTIVPPVGTYATSYVVQADGFTANEQVVVAVFLSDGSAAGLPAVSADASGHLYFTISPYNEWHDGTAVVSAAGMRSGRRYSASFQLVHDTIGTSGVTPGAGTYATSYTVQANGFIAGELVFVAAYLSDGTGVGLPAVRADASGIISFSLIPLSEWPAGQVTVVASGTSSVHKVSPVFQLAHDTSGMDASSWNAEYYNNPNLAGDPALTRTDTAVDFNWGLGSPAPGVAGDNFSARWTTTRNVNIAANYSVIATADDGVRAWVDGQLVIDAWNDHSATKFSATVYLGTGPHTIRIEYYEHLEKAVMILELSRI